MTETRYQRVAREQAERQKARMDRRANELKALNKARRETERYARVGRKEKAYLDALASDHNHEMDA